MPARGGSAFGGKIYLATDHAGFDLKERGKIYFQTKNYEIEDFGALELNPEDDYPDFIFPAMKALNEDVKHSVLDSRGIIFGGSGQGEAMIANRFSLIRAVVCDDNSDLTAKVKVWREHNNSNVLSFGARFIDEKSALDAVKIWLETTFPAETRHLRRLTKISRLNFS